jgi:hypothetical protein
MMDTAQGPPRTPEENDLYARVLAWLSTATIGDEDEGADFDSPRGSIYLAIKKADPAIPDNEGPWPYDFCVWWAGDTGDLPDTVESLGQYGTAEFVAQTVVWFFRDAEEPPASVKAAGVDA